MKRTLFLLTLSIASQASAAVGDTVDIANLKYVADGITVSNTFGSDPLSTNIYRADSPRFYDSTKGAGDWVAKYNDGTTPKDSLLCWAHTSANVIEYWQSYYGVFAKPQVGDYFDGSFLESGTKPLPYGKVGTEEANYGNTSQVPDSRSLAVSREMYYNMIDAGGRFKWAAEWYFSGDNSPVNSDGDNVFKTKSLGASTGGYYANYFTKGQSFTTVFSEYTNEYTATLYPEHVTEQSFATGSIEELTQALLPAFGLEKQADGTYIQTEKGKIAFLGVWTDTTKTDGTIESSGHMITCYGFTTDADGNLATILIANSDTESSYDTGSKASELIVKQVGDRLMLYTTDKNKWLNTKGYYIGEVSYINTPQALKDMLAEYSDVANEAQVWSGKDSTWEAQVENINELPTEATGWDIFVNGADIAEEHQGYYHTYSTDGRAVIFGEEGVDNKAVTINGTVKTSHITVSAAGYEFKAGTDAAIAGAGEGEKANLTITSGASLSSEVQLNLGDLTLENGAELSSDKVIEVHGAFLVQLQEAVTFGLARAAVTPEASVNADLDLRDATSITLNAEVNMNNHNLILSANTPITLSLNEVDGSIVFFTNIAQLSIVDGEVTTVVTEGANLTQYFSNISSTDGRDLSGYQIIYANGALSMTLVPEPTTATLSLLALAALASRRRRK